MSANKENKRYRLPVLKDRFASTHLGKKECETAPSTVIQRYPLKTLSNHNYQNVENCLAGPSQISDAATNKMLDTRHVTYRNNQEREFEWKLEVFEGSNDENEDNNEQTESVLNTAAIFEIKPVLELTTPTNIVLKKIKKSLTRPQFTDVEVKATTISAKSCHCTIHSSSDVKEPNTSLGDCFDYLNEEYLFDNLKHMLASEKKIRSEPNIRKASRSCLINWIINVNGCRGNPAVVQLACLYLDGYMATNWVAVNRLQVIAAACFWIAIKYQGRQISGRTLVKYAGNAFSEKELVAAERNILNKMKFQTMLVVPHDFVPYVSWCCDRSDHGRITAAAVFFCQCGLLIDRSLNEEYPSVVAAAAVKNAVFLLRRKKGMDGLKSCLVYKEATKKATRSLNVISAQLREAVRMVSSFGYEYKAPLFKLSGAPYYITNVMVKAVNTEDVLNLDAKKKRATK